MTDDNSDTDSTDSTGIIAWFRRFITRRSTYREGDSDYDGAFSYAAEWHAFTHGVYKGFTTRPTRHPPQPDFPDVEKEPHYYRGGYVIGSLVQVGVIGLMALVGYLGLGVV